MHSDFQKLPFFHNLDTGVDDGFVQFFQSASNTLPLGYIAADGCTALEQVVRNIQTLRRLTSCDSVPIYVPRFTKLSRPPSLERFFGENGLNNFNLPASHNGTYEIEKLTFLEPFRWLETGPCTNLARMLQTNSGDIKQNLRQIVIMGGVFEGPGIVGSIDPKTNAPCAEFNFYHDAEAVDTVLYIAERLGVEVVIVSWDQCRLLKFLRSEIFEFRAKSPGSGRILDITRAFFSLYPKGDFSDELSEPGYVPADSIAWAAFQGEFGTLESVHMHIETNTQSTFYGQTRLTEGGHPIKRYVLKDVEGLKAYILDLMGWF